MPTNVTTDTAAVVATTTSWTSIQRRTASRAPDIRSHHSTPLGVSNPGDGSLRSTGGAAEHGQGRPVGERQIEGAVAVHVTERQRGRAVVGRELGPAIEGLPAGEVLR